VCVVLNFLLFLAQRPALAFAASQGWTDGVRALLAVKKELKLNVDSIDAKV
jgi:hypothetical protein